MGRRWAVAGLVVCVAVALASGCTTTAGKSPGDTSGDAGSGRSGCPSDVDASIPNSPLDGVVWERVADQVPVLLPTSTRYGPCRVDTTASGYARTPRGAVIAAAQLAVRASVPGSIGVETIESQVVPGPWRDTLLDAVDDADAAGPVRGMALVGFSVAAWSPDQARVAWAARYDHLPGQFLVLSVDLTWRDGDWWLHPPPGGDWANAVAVRATLPSQFVAWGAA